MGLVFNSKKCFIKQSSISFFGNNYTAHGIKPDPEKIRDIVNMPTPQTKEQLHSFIGYMTYLSQCIPNFADKVQTLRDLLKDDVPWVWHEDHQQHFEELKQQVSAQSCLKYYEKNCLTQRGLGAALVQDGGPVAFASKALTEIQSGYSNIECELLAVVRGVESCMVSNTSTTICFCDHSQSSLTTNLWWPYATSPSTEPHRGSNGWCWGSKGTTTALNTDLVVTYY